MNYEPVYDGEVVKWHKGVNYIACCDCGLVHKYIFSKKVKTKIFRCNKRTRKHRAACGVTAIKTTNKGALNAKRR